MPRDQVLAALSKPAIEPQEEGSGGRSSRPRGWLRRHGSAFRFVIGLALGALALWAVSGQRAELADASRELGRLDVDWLVVAVFGEAMSVVAFARMQGTLLKAGGVRMPTLRLLSMTTAAGAIASSMPAGPAVSSVFAYQQYRRFGADEALAVWTLAATLVSSALGLSLMATAGLAIAERQGAAFDLVGVTIGVLFLTIVAAAVLWQRKALSRVGLAALRLARRVTGRPRRHEAEVLASVVSRLGRVQLSWHEYARALGWSVANWAFDCSCLACGFLAVHAPIPWQGLLLAYGAGQLASNLPITPGGLGVVEGSLTIALVAYGGAQASTVGAVLLYRIVSFWAFLPVGWLLYALIVLRDRRLDRAVLVPAAVPLLGEEGSVR
ncbi:MAG TPA: YbhN family protein [Acidimicrobiales bacterium]|nr:YbhN family protein [Acidimicrobiales bacterium]